MQSSSQKKILQRAQLSKARVDALCINWSIEECYVDVKLLLFIKISKHNVVGAAIFNSLQLLAAACYDSLISQSRFSSSSMTAIKTISEE